MNVNVLSAFNPTQTHSHSVSGLDELRLGEELEVMVLSVGLPVNGLP